MQNTRTKLFGFLIAHLAFVGLFLSTSPATPSNASRGLFTIVAKDESFASKTGQPKRAASAAKTQPAKKDYSKFTHASHDGTVTIPGSKKTVELKCGTCHAVTKEKPEPTSYPVEDLSQRNIPRAGSQHTACLICHGSQFHGSGAGKQGPTICLVCHVKAGFTAKELKPFPDPAKKQSDFGDGFSHKEHAGYFKNYSAKVELPEATPNESGKDSFRVVRAALITYQPKTRFDCTKCHVPDKDGVSESAPAHTACFVCHFDTGQVPEKSDVYAPKCAGCHSKSAPFSVHEFKRHEVIPDSPKNPAFSHKTHEGEMKDQKGAALCLKCHVTGLTAKTRAELFFNEKTKLQQPPFSACIDCHATDGKKPRATVKPENVKCLKCHALAKVQSISFEPPPSHTDSGAPAAKPTDKPPDKPMERSFK